LPCSQNGRSRWLSRGSTRSGILFSELKTRFPQSVKALKVERGIDLPKKGKLRMGCVFHQKLFDRTHTTRKSFSSFSFLQNRDKERGVERQWCMLCPGSPKVTCNAPRRCLQK
jgi:hypothetical protein